MGCDPLFVVLTGGRHISCASGLIKFNLATLAGKTIQSATLRLTTSAAGVGSYKDPWVRGSECFRMVRFERHLY